MNTGLAKLVEATKSVNELSQELAVKEKELAVASKKADVVLKVAPFAKFHRKTVVFFIYIKYTLFKTL